MDSSFFTSTAKTGYEQSEQFGGRFGNDCDEFKILRIDSENLKLFEFLIVKKVINFEFLTNFKSFKFFNQFQNFEFFNKFQKN